MATSWNPVSVVQSRSAQPFALLMLNQAFDRRLLDAFWSRAVFRVAADGGANFLHAATGDVESYGQDLNALVGDLDSVRPAVRDYYAGLGVDIIHRPDVDATDFAKAMRHIRSTQNSTSPGRPWDVVVLGGVGGRVDQGISVLHHLFCFQETYDDGRVFLVSDQAISFVLLPGRHSIRLLPEEGSDGELNLGKYVGIIPMKGKTFLTTHGLEWDVEDWETEVGGRLSTSNHVREALAEVTTTKDVLFTVDVVRG